MLGPRPFAWLARRLVALALLLVLATWMLPHFDGRTLPGLRVAGAAFERTDDPVAALTPLASEFASGELAIRTGPHLTRASRRELGARIDVDSLGRRLLEVGRSGNPMLDVVSVWDVLLRGRELSWSPTIDRIALGRYVQAVRRNVERPPIAGATDEQGWSIEGVPGLTLDVEPTVVAIERALRRGERTVDVPLRQIMPPVALAIGSPDAVLYEDEQDEDAGHHHAAATGFAALAAGNVAELMAKLRPIDWLPSRGKEPMDPPYERFGQGPRKVPRPFGEPAALAEQLGLGRVEAVGQLLRGGPKHTWIEAAGARGGRGDMLWPVPSGRLWRRFGYVRKAEFANKLHRGVDIGAPAGTPLLAVNDGIVAYSDNGVRGYGNLLAIVHSDGSVTFSAHCQAIYVFAGQRVERGRVVAEVGDTGLARGAHVHFEYHVRGEPVDPIDLFARP